MKQSTVKYCVGCGLCKACVKADTKINEKGFTYPVSGDQEWLDRVCPIGNLPLECYDPSDIWGRNSIVYYGWSMNQEVRKKASSGGILTETACFLLNSKAVDAVIHVTADPQCQVKNVTTVSTTPEEVIAGCGSRYSISSPLDIVDKLDRNKKYAFIGKPCDVVALRNYQKFDDSIGEVITVLLSFFCMGLPSEDAQDKLLNALGSDRERCRELVYRGNGWPGFATATNNDGRKGQIDYVSSWGNILGRDVMNACKFCLDGIGEAADISCGDAWYVGKDGGPDFSERDGRNIIFARTEYGNEILQKMQKEGVVELKEAENYKEYLPVIQRSQFLRRASMKGRIMALKLLGRPYPSYPVSMLNGFQKEISFKERTKAFLGALKRTIKKRV